jgi:hypothetical protein
MMAAVLAALMVNGTQTSLQNAVPATMVQNQGKPEATFMISKDQRINPAGIHPESPNVAKSPYWSGPGILLSTSVTTVPESRTVAGSGAKAGSAMVELTSAVVAFDVGSTGGLSDRISALLVFSAESPIGGGGEGVEVGVVFELGHSEKFREAMDTRTKHGL